MTAEFSASLLQSSVTHDPSELILIWWLDAQGTFLIIDVEESLIFLWKWSFIFRISYKK